MSTDPNPTTPAAGTGGVAEHPRCLPIYFRNEQQQILDMEARGLREDVDFVIHDPGPTPEGRRVPQPATPAPDALSHPSVAPELPARSEGSAAQGAAAERHTYRGMPIATDDPGYHCPRCGLDDSGIRGSLKLIDREAGRAQADPSPERAAGGAGLPTVEEMAEALWEIDRVKTSPAWPDILARPESKWRTQQIEWARNRAAAILARLASSRDRTADPVTENAVTPPSVTVSAAPSWELSADGRVDAGAVREAAQRYREAVKAFMGWIPDRVTAEPFRAEEGAYREGVDDAGAALDAALDRAGDGSFQARNAAWMAEVMRDDPTDLAERVHRFTEEALELGQSLGQTRDEVGQIADYVHGRPKGDPMQEVGGTETTLALLCAYAGIDKVAAGEAELARCSTPEIVAKIREKRSKRHGRGPLPGTYAPDFVPQVQP